MQHIPPKNKYHKYDPAVKWQFMLCPRCGRFRWCCQHHIHRRVNSNICVWVCSNGNGVELYPDSCHEWIHSNPEAARKEGLYNPFSKNLYKKRSRREKWKIKQKKSLPSKWIINK